MFKEEKSEWDKFFNYFNKKFSEDVGIMPAVYEDKNYEIDLVIGDKSDNILGIRIINYVQIGETDKKVTDLFDEGNVEDKNETNDTEDEDEDDDDDADAEYEIFAYDLVRNMGKLTGKPMIRLSVPISEPEDENQEVKDELIITIHSETGEVNSDITCAVMIDHTNDGKETFFGEDPKLDK